MRVRLHNGSVDNPLSSSLPLAGRILHPESNLAEWFIVSLDSPVVVAGVTTELLCLRPAGRVRPGPVAIPVHVSLVIGTYEIDGRTVYKLGELLGQALCLAET